MEAWEQGPDAMHWTPEDNVWLDEHGIRQPFLTAELVQRFEDVVRTVGRAIKRIGEWAIHAGQVMVEAFGRAMRTRRHRRTVLGAPPRRAPRVLGPRPDTRGHPQLRVLSRRR